MGFVSVLFLCLCTGYSHSRRHYVFGLSVRRSCCCEHDICRVPWGNYFKFGTNVCVYSKMNWLDFGGWRSSTLWFGRFHSHECGISRTPWGNYFKFGTNIQLDLMMNRLNSDGQRSSSLWPCVRLIFMNAISQEGLNEISSNLAQRSKWI